MSNMEQRPVVKSDGICLKHSRDWYRRPGDYACKYVVNVITSEIDDEGVHTLIRQAQCPLGLRVHEETDEYWSKHYSAMLDDEVKVQRTSVLAPGLMASLVPCIIIEPTTPPNLSINTQVRPVDETLYL
jgi:hypothetical protein